MRKRNNNDNINSLDNEIALTNNNENLIKISNTAQGLIIAQANDREILRLMTDGRIYVHGNYADTDKKVVDGLRMFINTLNNVI